VLADCQAPVCTSLASKLDDKFQDVAFSLSELGSPIIEGALAWIDCVLVAVHEAGDLYIVLGRVAGLSLHREGDPMIFHKSGYATIWRGCRGSASVYALAFDTGDAQRPCGSDFAKRESPGHLQPEPCQRGQL